MGKRSGKRAKGKHPPADRRAAPQAEKPQAEPARPDEKPAPRGFLRRRPILRFVLLFAVLMTAFHLLFFAPFSEGLTYKRYLNLNAAVSGKILGVLGYPVRVVDERISSTTRGFSISVRRGCDAIQPMALFASALIAFPVSIRSKVPALVLGLLALAALNLVRIVSLYIIGLQWPRVFHVMHADVWQAIFIFLAVLLWISWAWWATRDRAVQQPAG